MPEAVTQEPAVLVIDDNPLIINVLKSLLSSENYHVYTCNDGTEAIDLLDQKDVDVIICDVMMPNMDGYELHKKVRENEELSHIPFVFLTALGEDDDINRGKELGADDYLVKPFDPRELLSVVKGKVARSRSLREYSEKKYDGYRKKVIHTLSHEFRTPLVAINTGTELLLDQQGRLDPQKTAHLLEAIYRGGQRLERLVNDFMLLQQIEAGIAKRMYQQRATELDLNDSVEQLVNGVREELEKEGFKLSVKSFNSNLMVSAYEPQIHDILNRVIDNARKFHSEVREIEVVIYRQEHEAVVEVRDRGIGFDVEKIQEVIDVFGQLDRERLEQQGGGLGLAIANRYAAIHGGRLEFESRKGGGTTVALILPLSGN